MEWHAAGAWRGDRAVGMLDGAYAVQSSGGPGDAGGALGALPGAIGRVGLWPQGRPCGWTVPLMGRAPRRAMDGGVDHLVVAGLTPGIGGRAGGENAVCTPASCVSWRWL